MPGRTDKADTILKKRLADDVGMLGIAFDQGEIQAVVQHGVFDKTGIIYGDLGINARQLPGILLNERGQEKITDRNAGADPQSSGLLPGRNFFFHFIKQRYDMQRVVVELFPLLCDEQASGKPFKQTYLIVLLQLTYRKAYRRLCKVQPIRCPGNAPLLIYSHKNPKMTQCHKFCLPVLIHNKMVM